MGIPGATSASGHRLQCRVSLVQKAEFKVRTIVPRGHAEPDHWFSLNRRSIITKQYNWFHRKRTRQAGETIGQHLCSIGVPSCGRALIAFVCPLESVDIKFFHFEERLRHSRDSLL